jgi:hypothetical protein
VKPSASYESRLYFGFSSSGPELRVSLLFSGDCDGVTIASLLDSLKRLRGSDMQLSHRLRAGLIGLFAVFGVSISSLASADSGTVIISVVKGGWFVGANGGWGTLVFHGRRYPLSIGGVDAGLVFGLSQTTFYGRVINIRSPWDVTGVYGAAGAGAALGIGARLIQLANDKGAILQLEGRQIGLIANLDLSGLVISLE